MTPADFFRPVIRRKTSAAGFTLVELMVIVLIISILALIALPNYNNFLRRAARGSAQSQLIELSGIQEKIFLNSNAYAESVDSAYSGTASGGLGVQGAKTLDGKYNLTISVTGSYYVLAATPVSGGAQEGDGQLSISSTGVRVWGSSSW